MRQTYGRFRRGSILVAAGTALFVTAAGGSLLMAQDANKKSLWDGVYTADQANRGSVTYSASCSQCHGATLEGDGRYKALVGDTFWTYFQGRTLDYMLDFVSKNMPNNAPGSLDSSKYPELVAFILSKNDVPPTTVELTAANATGIPLDPKTGPIMKDLPDKTAARVIGCLTKGGASGWMVNNAPAPYRADDKKAQEGEATKPLGDRSVPLLFVLTSLDKYVGHKVWVKGVLSGEGGKNGINVTDVGSLADSCQ